MAKLTADGWELIVDKNVDANADGSNENGFGSPAGCTTNKWNFMPWSLADFNDMLMVGISGYGARVLYTDTGLSEDGSWHYSVGSGNAPPPAYPAYVDPLGAYPNATPYPNGFDGYKYANTPDAFSYQNLAVNLAPIGTTLWGGTIVQYIPEMGYPPLLSQVQGLTDMEKHQWPCVDAGDQ